MRNGRGEDTGREGKATWSERQRTGVMWTQAKGNRGAGCPQKPEEARRSLPWGAFRERSPSDPSLSDHWPPNYERILAILLSHELIGAGCGRPWTQHTLSPWYGGVNGDLLQESLCYTQVCCTQSPCPCSRPLLTRTSTGDTQR